MKIYELIRKPLTQYRRLKPGTETEEFLEKHGFYSYGSGNFGTVYFHPKLDYALKIFTHEDIGYKSFLSYAYDNPSPYLPKFKGKPMQLSKHEYAIRMEKLNKIPSAKERDPKSPYFNVVTYALMLDMGTTATKIHTSEGYIDVTINDLALKIGELFPGLLKIIHDLDIIGDRIGGGLDLTIGNIMTRDNGHLVITDPLWGESR